MSEPLPDARELLKRAYLEIRGLKARLAELDRDRREAVALVGLACRFPGGAEDPQAFWDLLRRGIDPIGPVPPGRWPGRADDLPALGGFLADCESFDAAFFEITPREAAAMDPQHRLLLEVAWEALEDAAIAPDRLAGSRTGVFVGLATNDFAARSRAAAVDRFYGSGTSPAVAAGRIAYFLDLKGPCLTIDTACSSSLAALHLAVRALRDGECDLALVGGVSLMLAGDLSRSFAQAGMLAPDGRCKAFDARADGYGRSEGCAVVVLRRRSDAVAAGDRIRAVIRGSAMNQDGRSAGLTAPNGPAQVAVIQRALRDAAVSPEAIDLVEAHGSGTSLGDVIEAQALATAFAGRSRPLLVGTVKSNIAHAEAAAGLAGLIKATLALEQDEVAPNLHFRQLNPEIRTGDVELRVPTEPTPGVRMAGVSSFGFSGTNVHVVLERAPEPVTASPTPGAPVLLLSAKDEGALARSVEQYRQRLATGALDFAAACHTAAVGRARFDRWVMARSPAELAHVRPRTGPPPEIATPATAKIALPTYAFRRQRFPLPGAPDTVETWLDPEDERLAGTGGRAHLGVLLSLIGDDVTALADVRFPTALRVRGSTRVHVRREAGEITLMSGGRPDGPAVVHLQARSCAASAWRPVPPAPPGAIEPAAVRLYPTIEAAGFHYGPEARLLAGIVADGTTAHGRLTAGRPARDPGVIEAAAQLVYALLPQAERLRPMLAGCRRLQLAGPAARAQTVWMALRQSLEEGGIEADFGVLDPRGEPVAVVEGARFARSASFARRFGHEVVWEAAPPVQGAAAAPALVIGAPELPWQDDMAGALHAAASDPLVLFVVREPEPRRAITALQSFLRQRPLERFRLLVATHGAQVTGRGVEWSAAAGGAAVWGLAQAITAEQPGRRCRLVDLDPTRAIADQIEALALECAAVEPAATAWRQGRRFARALGRVSGDRVGPPCQAVLRNAGAAPVLAWEPAVAAATGPPAAGTVLIEVVAAGLTFRDRLAALGMVAADTPLGADVAGIVRAVGPGVTDFRPGERVVALAQPGLADLVAVPSALVRRAPVPDLVAAATMPVAYATAALGLGDLAGGERVLVHQAAGGTGLAALALCRAAGAEVVGTASAARRAFLEAQGLCETADSRAPETWRALGPFDVALGAFDGVRPLATRIVELARAVDGAFDLDRTPPSRRQEALARLDGLPPLPRRTFRRDELDRAIDTVGERIGRNVVLLREPPAVRIDPDAAYVVTGGAGALGARLGRWLRQQGAASVVLVDRVEGEAAPGLRHVVADAADRGRMEALLAEIDAGPFPLRGVFHAAAVADAGSLVELDGQRLDDVLRGKVAGARLFDDLTRDRSAGRHRLDHFVLFGSVVSLLPSAGQPAYAAANAVLDQIAQARRAVGLPGLSLSLGPIAAGIGERMGERAHEVWQRHGIARIDPDELVEAMPELLAWPWPQLALIDVDWAAYEAGERPVGRVSGTLDVAGLQTLLAPIVGAARPGDLDPDAPLLSLGLDSLMAVEFAQAIGRARGRPVPRTFAYGHPNLRAAAAALSRDEPEARPAFQPSTVIAAPHLAIPIWELRQASARQGPLLVLEVLGEGTIAAALRALGNVEGPIGTTADLRPLDAPEAWPSARRVVVRDLLDVTRARLHGGRRMVWAAYEDSQVAELLAGLVATLRLEHPGLRPRLIRLRRDLDEPARALAAELACDEEAGDVLLQARGRAVRREHVVQPAAAGRSPWRSDGTYLLTGGTGGVGRWVARHLLRARAGRVVLVSRRGQVPAELEGHGQRVRGAACDLAAEGAVETLLDELAGDGPPLRGILHLAGVTADGLLAAQDVDGMEPAFQVKADAALRLDRLSHDRALDHFVLFSSLTARMGLVGAGAYAAANAVLDGIARARHEAGLPAVSIAWGAWIGVGLAAQRERWERAGLPAYPAEAALGVLDAAVTGGWPCVAVVARAASADTGLRCLEEVG